MYNRRYFLECAEKELARASRYHHALSLAILDIDFFKHINDTYGHPAGDLVLTALGKFCLSHTRENDIVGRIGGEELAFFLLHANHEEAVSKMEMLRTQLSELLINYDSKHDPLTITASIGIASMSSNTYHFEALYLEADKKLYEAKASGRNKVVS